MMHTAFFFHGGGSESTQHVTHSEKTDHCDYYLVGNELQSYSH